MFLFDSQFFPAAEQIVQFDYISIIYLVVILVSLIFGICKGFLKTLLSLIAWGGSLLIAFFVITPITNVLRETALNDSIYNGIYGWLSNGNEEVFSTIITMDNKGEVIPQILEYFKFPSFLNDFVITSIESYIPQEGIEAGFLLCDTITIYALNSIVFIGAWLISFIILLVIKAIIKKVLKNKFIKITDRVFGSLSGLVIGVSICLITSYILSFIVSINENIYNYFDEVMHLSDPSVYTISKMLFEQNFLQQIILYFTR